MTIIDKHHAYGSEVTMRLLESCSTIDTQVLL